MLCDNLLHGILQKIEEITHVRLLAHFLVYCKHPWMTRILSVPASWTQISSWTLVFSAFYCAIILFFLKRYLWPIFSSNFLLEKSSPLNKQPSFCLFVCWLVFVFNPKSLFSMLFWLYDAHYLYAHHLSYKWGEECWANDGKDGASTHLLLCCCE